MDRDVPRNEPPAAPIVSTGTSGSADEPAGVMRRAEPVREFLLIPFGEIRVDRPIAGRSFFFARDHAESAVAWFESLGRKLAIDYEHQSLEKPRGRADGLRPAAGWIGRLEIREDGLWAAEVEWTDRARELIASGEYRYFSPVIYWADEEYRTLRALGPVALTNDPAMLGVPPLAAARSDAPATRCAARAFCTDRAAETQTTESLIAARREIEVLRKRLLAQEADAFVERGMRLGKITDANSMDWRADYLRDAREAEERLSRAPVTHPPGRWLTPAPDARTTAAVREGWWGADAADWEAFERAQAAGRVHITQ